MSQGEKKETAKSAQLNVITQAFVPKSSPSWLSWNGSKPRSGAADHESSLDLFSSQAGAGCAAAEVVQVAAITGAGSLQGCNHALLGLHHTLSRQVQLPPVSSDHIPLVLCHLTLHSCTQCSRAQDSCTQHSCTQHSCTQVHRQFMHTPLMLMPLPMLACVLVD